MLSSDFQAFRVEFKVQKDILSRHSLCETVCWEPVSIARVVLVNQFQVDEQSRVANSDAQAEAVAIRHAGRTIRIQHLKLER